METAGGDQSRRYALSYEAFNHAGCDVTQLSLFPRFSGEPEERLCGSDDVGSFLT
jgi:hypothetical protein